MCVRACVRACVRERHTQREREREKQTDRERDRKTQRDRGGGDYVHKYCVRLGVSLCVYFNIYMND